MSTKNQANLISSVFITFSGNCKKALTFYQTCFGGQLQFEHFEKQIADYQQHPVIIGSLVSDRFIIHGSDLVPQEGRRVGNYISIFLKSNNDQERNEWIQKLNANVYSPSNHQHENQGLIEIIDPFGVRWVLG